MRAAQRSLCLTFLFTVCRVFLKAVGAALTNSAPIEALTVAPLDDAARRSIDALELRKLSVLSTLSPMPGFRRWLRDNSLDLSGAVGAVAAPTLSAANTYLLSKRAGSIYPIDSVAHFHLSNGRLACSGRRLASRQFTSIASPRRSHRSGPLSSRSTKQ